MTTITLSVDAIPAAGEADSGGDRLDRWLAAHLAEHSRNAIQRWIKDGLVLVNDRPARANLRLSAGDRVQVELPDAPRAPATDAEAIPLDIVYEDQDIVVINKPAGQVVHPAPGHMHGTLVNALLHHIPDLAGIGGEARPGIVHRLDKDTSGVMVVAKHERALRHLQAQFKARKVKKEYIALVEGKIAEDQGHITAAIGRDPRDRKRMAVIKPDAGPSVRSRPAVTDFEVVARYSVALHNDPGRGTYTLVNAQPRTGRTHQIRVHFAALGHPLVSDPIYGVKRQRLAVPRLFLHAERLTFELPATGEHRRFSVPLPDELQAVIDELEVRAIALG